MHAAVVLLAALSSLTSNSKPSSSQASDQCKAYFSVVWKDRLGNVKQGLSKDDVKWMQRKMQKKYSGLCYAAPDPSVHLVFWISTKKATYHGYRTTRDTHSEPINGTVTDDDGNTANISGTQEVTTTSREPESFDYPVFTLSIEQEAKGKWSVMHNFQRQGICRTIAAIPIHCHTSRYIIEDAMKWIQAEGLHDGTQPVIGVDPAGKPDSK